MRRALRVRPRRAAASFKLGAAAVTIIATASLALNQDARMTRVYLARAALAAGATVALPAAAARKLRAVLRLQAGDAVEAFNARDGEFTATVGARAASLRVGARLRAPPPLPCRASSLLVVYAPLRTERSRALVEQATQLGATAIMPVATARGRQVLAAADGGADDDDEAEAAAARAAAAGLAAARAPPFALSFASERAAEWAHGAVEQSGRLSAPRTAAPAATLAEFLAAWAGGDSGVLAALAALPRCGSAGGAASPAELAAAAAALAPLLPAAPRLLLVADPTVPAAATVARAIRAHRGAALAVLVGPEGGFSPAEAGVLAALEGAAVGVARVGLGALTLRAETAVCALLVRVAAAREEGC